jgi:hypothetical protein
MWKQLGVRVIPIYRDYRSIEDRSIESRLYIPPRAGFEASEAAPPNRAGEDDDIQVVLSIVLVNPFAYIPGEGEYYDQH